MALFKNISTVSINLNVNGVLKRVNPNGLVNIPDNMSKLYLKNTNLKMVGMLTEKTTQQVPPTITKLPRTKKKERPHLYNPMLNKKVVNNVIGHDNYNLPVNFNNAKQDYEDIINFIKRDFNEKVSICILTIDNYDVIKKCIDCINENIKYKNIEVLIGDTGTTDIQVLDFYDTLDKNKFTVFKGLEFNFSKNNNFLVSKSTGDFVLIMNNDVYLTHDNIGEMVKLLHFYQIGTVGSRLVYDDNHNVIQHDGQTLHNGDNWTALGHVNLNKNIREVPGINGFVCGNTAALVMVRKHLFNEVGGFDEDYLDIFQDVDLNLKISAKGFKHFCLREKFHIHVDHGTRNEGPDMGSKRIQEIQSDQRKIANDWLRTKKPPSFSRPTFSFIVCSTNHKQIQSMCNSINSKITHDLLIANNKKGIFKSASESLNTGILLSNSKYNILCHQDIIFEKKESLGLIIQRIEEIEKYDISWGVLGVAGAGWKGESRLFEHYMNAQGKSSENYKQVQTVDECIMILKNNKMLGYDENTTDHWHFYGADICLTALNKGFNNYVINIPITHLSNGSDNLKNHFKEYKIQCKRLLSKWRDYYSQITTTTMQLNKNKIMYFATPSGTTEYEELVEE